MASEPFRRAGLLTIAAFFVVSGKGKADEHWDPATKPIPATK